MNEVGISPQRFNLKWASAAEAPRFVKLITEFTEKIKDLGPLGEAEGVSHDEALARINKALQIVSDKKVRMAFGNVTKTLRKEGSKVTREAIAALVNEKMSKSINSGLESA